MQGEHWIMIAKLRHQLYFADSLGRRLQLPQEKLQTDDPRTVPASSEPLWILYNICGFSALDVWTRNYWCSRFKRTLFY